MSSHKGTISCLALILVLSFGAFAQDSPNTNEWGQKFNTPGATLTVKETHRTQMNERTVVHYDIFASGLPTATEYILWFWVIGGRPQSVARAYISSSGQLVNNPPNPQHPSGTTPIDFAALGGKGEPKRLALTSKDGQYRAFHEVVPFPIEAHDNSCTLSVVMGAPRYSIVAVQGSGFQPSEELFIETQSENEKGQGKTKVSDQGTFVAVVGPIVKGKASGNTRFTVTGEACKVSVEFPWGQDSYQYQ